MPSISLISAMSHGRVIGTADGMPWQIPTEYQQYLHFITGQTVIMGRRSYEIFGEDLTSAHALVISRSFPSGSDYEVFDSLEKALTRGQELGKTIFVAGGASIYAQALPLADEMYLSTIPGEYEGTAYFPEFDPGDWEIIEERTEPDFIFRHYQRKP
jgi:dihydrofolate reductase